jgi:homoserine dehydrogenase
MSDIQSFRQSVETFIAARGWTPTRFGRAIAGDPLFVFDLREGREPRSDTRQRILKAMQDYDDGASLGPLRLGIAGLGNVGASLVRIVEKDADELARKLGRKLLITAVSARNRSRDRGISLSQYEWFDDPVALARSDSIDLFVELIGGEDGPALAAIKSALEMGRPVVTANKALLAKHGVNLARLAEESGAQLGFEAAVAGGIPVIKTLREGLGSSRIERVYGILNGTCNYILTRMGEEGIDFAQCLRDAQALGYAELDPSFDIDGHDTAHKLAIVSSLCFACEIARRGHQLDHLRGYQGRRRSRLQDQIAGHRPAIGGRHRTTGASNARPEAQRHSRCRRCAERHRSRDRSCARTSARRSGRRGSPERLFRAAGHSRHRPGNAGAAVGGADQ